MGELAALYRECARKKVDLRARLTLLSASGSRLDTGRARIVDISSGGALLVNVQLNRGTYPSERFQIDLRMDGGPYHGVGFLCEPVRFVPDVKGIGVRFQETFLSV